MKYKAIYRIDMIPAACRQIRAWMQDQVGYYAMNYRESPKGRVGLSPTIERYSTGGRWLTRYTKGRAGLSPTIERYSTGGRWLTRYNIRGTLTTFSGDRPNVEVQILNLPDGFFLHVEWGWTTSAGNRTTLHVTPDDVTLTVEGRRHGCRMPSEFIGVEPAEVVEYSTHCPSSPWWESGLEPETPIEVDA